MLYRAALFLLAVPLFGQIPFTEFIVFGDSLSDNGNLYAGTTLLGQPTPGPPMYATAEYTDGTNSVPSTTGPLGLWIEQLATKLALPVPQPFAKGGTNYAVGGALTGKDPAYSPTKPSIPWVTDQLNLFLGSNRTPPATALYVFWGGANDILQDDSASAAVANIQGNIDTLATAGAKYFLWVNLPPLGEVPERVNTSDRNSQDAASMAYNQGLTSAVAQLKTAHPGITIVTLDAYSLFTSILANPSLYGFANTNSGAQGLTGVNPNTYLFWDMLHPTTVGHQYVASIAASALEAAFGGPSYTCTNNTAPLISSVDSASAYGGYSYFASGSWLEIKGTNLADPTDPRLTAASHPGEWTTADFSGLNAPTALDGISVSINGKAAYVWYLSTGQLNVQAPQDSTTGNVAITVTNCKATSSPFTFARQALAPGLLAPASFKIGGTQYMGATFAADAPQLVYVLNTSTGAALGINSRPSKPGDVIIAYGVGFGDVNPTILPGTIVEQSNSLINPVTVSFGTAPATLSYSGLAPALVGLYQFNIQVPSGLANGDYQINVTQNGKALPQTMYLTVQN